MSSSGGPGRSAGQERRAEKPRGYFIRSQFFAAPTIAPGLYIVATPIGNLGDISIRALDTLAGADLVACEDTRVTRKLLTRYGIETHVAAYHEHSEPRAHRRLLDALAEGRSVALVSDAGTPLISDPGALLVADAAAAGHAVVPVPGPSAAIAALSAAGLPTEAVLFAGFLPAKSAQRRQRLAALAAVPATLALFESPHRAGALLGEAAELLGGDRPAVLCRELTKLHETFDRGTLGTLAERYADAAPKGEVVVLIAPPAPAEPPEATDVDALLRAALATHGLKDAAQRVSQATGLPRRDMYRRALELKDAD